MVSEPIKFVYYVGPGEQTRFAYAYDGTVGFDVVDPATVKAAILNTNGTRDLNPSFVVERDAQQNLTGNILFTEAPAQGAVVYIYRETPETQETEWDSNSMFSVGSIRKAFDKLTRLVQEVFYHSKNKTLQLDPFQQQVLRLILTDVDDNRKLMFVDWDNQVITYTDFTIGRIVLSNEAGANDAHKIILRINSYTIEGNPVPYLEFSDNGGATWHPVGETSNVNYMFWLWLQAFSPVLNLLPEGGVAIPGIIKRNGRLFGTFYDSGIDPATTTNFPTITIANNPNN